MWEVFGVQGLEVEYKGFTYIPLVRIWSHGLTQKAGKYEFLLHPGRKRNRSLELLAFLCHSVPCNDLFLSSSIFIQNRLDYTTEI